MFFHSFLSIHLKDKFGVSESLIGIMFSIYPFAFLIGCNLTPYLLKNIPPSVQFYVCFIFLGIGAVCMGPSKLFGLDENLIYLQTGLVIWGLFNAPVFINILPYVYLNTQVEFNIVEKYDKKLDGIIAD